MNRQMCQNVALLMFKLEKGAQYTAHRKTDKNGMSCGMSMTAKLLLFH